MQSIANKKVIITGATGVLCSAMARFLAESGCTVGVLGRTPSKVEALTAELQAQGAEALGLVADVLDKAQLTEARKKFNEKYGPCDILINGAGGNDPGGITTQSFHSSGDEDNPDSRSFFDLDENGFKYAFDLNFHGTFLPTQVFAKDMVKRNGCGIINISSMTAYRPLTKVGAYSAAKAAVSSFTQWLAVHFAKEGIRVNAIAPGFFLTAQNLRLLTNEDGTYTDRGARIIDHTPMGRLGDPEDLLSTLEWLMSDSSSFVSGTVIPVDGGFMAYAGV